MNDREFSFIANHLGEALVQYTLDYNLPIRNTFLQQHSFTENQIEALDALYADINPTKKANISSDRQGFLMFIDHNNDDDIFTSCRKKCNGKLPTIEKDDKLISLISNFAFKCYPFLLIKTSNSSERMYKEGSIWPSSSSNKEFIALVREDLLNKLTNKNDCENDYYFSFTTTNGSSFTLNVNTACQTIVLKAFQNCCYRMQYDIGFFLNEVKQSIEKLRKLASGEKVEYSSFIGISGLMLQDVNKIVFSNCILRSIDKLSNPCSNLNLVACSERRGLISGGIIEIFHPIQVNLSIPNNEKFITNIFLNELRSYSERCLESLKFSICFGLNSAYAFISKFNENGFSLVLPGNFSYEPNKYSRKTTTITENDIKQVKAWYELLSSITNEDRKYIRIPLTRLDLAMHERDSPTDGFVDALIAWEALFSGTPETSFKIIGSLTKFLATPNERAKLFQKLTKIYNARSKIVHGSSSKYTPKEIEELRSESVSIALACLKKLIEYKKLLRMQPNERCKALLVLTDNLEDFKEKDLSLPTVSPTSTHTVTPTTPITHSPNHLAPDSMLFTKEPHANPTTSPKKLGSSKSPKPPSSN